MIREDFIAEGRSGLQNLPSRRPTISLGRRGRPWFSEEEAKHKGKNEQCLFRQQRLDRPVPKEDSAGFLLEEGVRRSGRSSGLLLTARPEVILGGWSGSLFRL